MQYLTAVISFNRLIQYKFITLTSRKLLNAKDLSTSFMTEKMTKQFRLSTAFITEEFQLQSIFTLNHI